MATTASSVTSIFIDYHCESSEWDSLNNSDVGSIVFSDLEERSSSMTSSTGPIVSRNSWTNDKLKSKKQHNPSHEPLSVQKRKRNDGVISSTMNASQSVVSTISLPSTSIFAGLEVITTPPTGDNGDFLQSTDPAFRRQILGIHETNRRNSKYVHNLEKNDVFIHGIQTITSSTTTVHGLQHGTAVISTNSSKTNQSQKITSTTNQVIPTKLIEPFILRTSIYEKFLIHFQNLYNEHDALAISTLLMYPCCKRDMTRELCGYQRIGPQNKLALGWKRTGQGDVCFRGGFELMFSKAPDCIMLFHTVKCHYTDRGTAVIAPYSYFFTVTVPLPNPAATSESATARVQSIPTTVGSPIFTTGQSPFIYKEIRMEIAGCNVYYYNHENLIVKQENHMVIKGCSDPTVPPHILIKCCGM